MWRFPLQRSQLFYILILVTLLGKEVVLMKKKIAKVVYWIAIIVFLAYINLYFILQLVDAIINGDFIWISIMLIVIEVVTLLIYRFVGQYGTKMESIERNPMLS